MVSTGTMKVLVEGNTEASMDSAGILSITPRVSLGVKRSGGIELRDTHYPLWVDVFYRIFDDADRRDVPQCRQSSSVKGS